MVSVPDTVIVATLDIMIFAKVTLVSGKGDADGVYRLLEEASEKRDEVCVDGCIYTKVVVCRRK